MNALIETEVEQLTQAPIIAVNNASDVSKATAVIKGIKGLIDKVKETFDPIVDKAHKSHKEAVAQRKKYLDPLEDQKKKYEGAISDYVKREEAEQRERERLANEHLAKVAEEAKQKLLNASKESVNEWEAEVLKEKAQEVKAVTVGIQVKFVEEAGVVVRKTWKARIINEKLIPRQYLIVDERMISLAAKDELFRNSGIPGVEFYEEVSTSVRG